MPSTFHDGTHHEASTISPASRLMVPWMPRPPSTPAVLSKQADASSNRQRTWPAFLVDLDLLEPGCRPAVARYRATELASDVGVVPVRMDARSNFEPSTSLRGERLSQVSVVGLGKVSQWVGLRVSPSVGSHRYAPRVKHR